MAMLNNQMVFAPTERYRPGAPRLLWSPPHESSRLRPGVPEDMAPTSLPDSRSTPTELATYRTAGDHRKMVT